MKVAAGRPDRDPRVERPLHRRLRAFRRGSTRAERMARLSGADLRRLLRSARAGGLVRERDRVRGRLPLGRELPRYLRNDRIPWVRRVSLLDRLPRGLDRRALRGRRAHQADGALHLGRRARLEVPFEGRQGGRRGLDARRLAVLPRAPDGRCGSARQAAARTASLGGSRTGWRRRHADRRDRGDGEHHLGAVPEGDSSRRHLWIRGRAPTWAGVRRSCDSDRSGRGAGPAVDTGGSRGEWQAAVG